jgi:hypothetical protein
MRRSNLHRYRHARISRPGKSRPTRTGHPWDPKPIAVSLNGLREALTAVAKAANGRENPIALEQHPITATERKTVLEEIQQHNPDIDLFFWALMMGDDLEGR